MRASSPAQRDRLSRIDRWESDQGVGSDWEPGTVYTQTVLRYPTADLLSRSRQRPRPDLDVRTPTLRGDFTSPSQDAHANHRKRLGADVLCRPSENTDG